MSRVALKFVPLLLSVGQKTLAVAQNLLDTKNAEPGFCDIWLLSKMKVIERKEFLLQNRDEIRQNAMQELNIKKNPSRSVSDSGRNIGLCERGLV
ncbi:hypothetical protein TNCV_2422701 [Trichonephila clavipes]|nr:hypothetical protein TNCV_2422701 [Trichonephila clavipes]